MSRVCLLFVLISGLLFVPVGCRKSKSNRTGWKTDSQDDIALPAAKVDDGMSLNAALARRRSIREYSKVDLTVEELSQLCWAGQGITQKSSGKRAAPSAGALYPIQLLVVTSKGVYQYDPKSHTLNSRLDGDLRLPLQKAALNQESVGNAPVSFVVTMDVAVTAKKYGKDAQRYCLMEAGHVAQNILLTATSLKLGAVPIGAVYEHKAASALKLPKNLRTVYVIPIGHPKGE
ncbi:MAG: SagB/ThcOx family dehydrogenase [Planctomycetaceae bacterium]